MGRFDCTRYLKLTILSTFANNMFVKTLVDRYLIKWHPFFLKNKQKEEYVTNKKLIVLLFVLYFFFSLKTQDKLLSYIQVINI